MASEQEKNKAIILALHEEVLNKGKYGFLSTAVATDFVDHPPKRLLAAADRRSEALREESAALREGFPDFHYHVIQIVAEGDRVVSLGRLTGTHRGAYRQITPSGGSLDMFGISSYRLKDGKVVERWGILDPAALMRSLASPSGIPRAH
jgi:predicted ester cyclase